jgi:Flp pilus assembly pilin Flp
VWVAKTAAAGMSYGMLELYGQISSALRRQDGQGATEYGLVIAVVLLSLAVATGLLAASITNFLDGVAALIDAVLS